MSETIASAEIRVGVDATGVEVGLRKIEESSSRTSRTIDNLGRGPGLRPLGDGAAGAAGQVDKSTKNMADAIARATAAMNSGAKGSAEYYAALANSRGLKMDVLRPYLAQLDEASKKAAAAAAAQKQLDDSMKFLADLKSRTDSIGKTASELMELRAAELGVADAARPMIERMREAEQAAETGASKFGKFGEVAEKAKGILLALGAGAALGAFAAAVNASVDNLAELDDMAQKTGSSIESLSRLQRVATVFAADMGQIDAALTKLARGMTSVDDEGSKVDRALKAIGLTARDATGKLRDPSELMADIAKKLQGYNDGAGKAALVTDLFGKAGADLLPYLNDLAENYDTMAVSSAAAATAAAQLQDQIGFAKLRFNDMANAVATAALPALSDLAGAMSDVLKSENDLSGGKGAEWADDLAVGFARLADVAMLLPRIFKAVANSFRVVAADVEVLAAIAKLRNPASVAAEYAKGNDPLVGLKKAIAERNQVLVDANTKYEELWNKPANQFEQAILKRISARNDAADATESGGGTDLNYSSTDQQGKDAEKAAEAYQNLISSIKEKIAMTAAEAASLTPLTESQKLQISLDEMMADSKRKLTPERKAEVEAAIKVLATNEQVIASQKRAAQGAADWLKIEKEWKDAAEKTIDTAAKEAERNEELARTFGMTKSAIEAVELARLEGQLAQRSSLGLTLTEIENLEKLIDAKKRNRDALASLEVQDANKKAADKAVQDWQRSAEQIGQSLTDNIMRGGKSAAEYLKDLFRTLVLRPTLQPIGNAVGAVATGLMGGAAPAQAAGSSALGSGVGTAVGALFGAGGLTGSLAAGAGWLTGATTLGGSLAAAGSLAATGSLAGIASSIGMAAGALGPIALGIGAAAALFKSAFGMKDKKYADTSSLVGAIGASGFAGAVDTAWTQKGGWFRSDKSGTDKAAVDAEMSKGLGAGYEAIKAASADFAKTLGINADFIKERAQAVNIALGKDEAANQKAIADFFVGVGNTIAGELLPEIGKFQAQGEAASATLQRLATGYSTIEQALWSIGMSFGAVGTASLEARERLLSAAGGIEAFAANTAGFQQNFLSEAERNAPVLKMVTEQMTALGLASVDTRDEFKQVVLGLDLTTEAGAKQYGALMNLQAAFAQVYPTAEALAAALAEQEEAARRAADATLQAAEAQARATEEARQAAIQATKDRAATLLSGVDSMFSALQSVVGREKSLLEQSANAHRALSQALRGTLDSMSVAGRELEDRQSARAQVQAALAIAKAGGVLPDADSLKGALSLLSKDASSMFATQQDYLRDFYSTQNDIAALAGLTDDALSVEEKSLKALDGILESAQQQINALKGIDYSVLTLAQAISGFKGALGAAQADPVASAGGSIAKLYQELLGRPADSAGLDYWQNAVAGGLSIDEVRKMIMQGSEYQLRGFAVGTNYVPTNMPAMIHEGERIIPAADNRELMRRLSSPGEGSAALVAEIKALRETVAKQQTALDKIVNHTGEHKEMFDKATGGGGPMLVEIEK